MGSDSADPRGAGCEGKGPEGPRLPADLALFYQVGHHPLPPPRLRRGLVREGPRGGQAGAHGGWAGWPGGHGF